MHFYVSWYPGDPWYPLYDDDCAMLISIASISREWTLSGFPKPPRRLMLDSGGYRYAIAPNERPAPGDLFERQLRIVEGLEAETILCSLDYPILDVKASSNEKDHCIDQTIAYAYEFRELMRRYRPSGQIEGMAVIQGYDVPSLVCCAQELQKIGFELYGLGSLAPLKYHREIIARVEAVMEVVGPSVHVFGIGAVQTLRALRNLGVYSVDSARPAKAAMYNQVFYSRPFRRFAIAASQDKVGKALPSHRRLSEPLPCECPACEGKAHPDIIKFGQREYVRLRTLHNYWHLKRAVTGMLA
jgi:7-cyano-7-deazaguanine tRNA-ribosyltransferase